MAANENSEFLYTWGIENFSFSYQRCGQCIRSPLFKVRILGGSEWSLLLYPRGYCPSTIDNVVCILYRYQYNEGDKSDERFTIDVRFELANSNDDTIKILEFPNEEILRGAKSKQFGLIEIDHLAQEMEVWTDDIFILRCYLIKTHDVLPLLPIKTYNSSFEAVTEICLDKLSRSWIIRVPSTSWDPEWSRQTEIPMPDMLPILINFAIVETAIHIEICCKVKYKYSRFISCSITLLDRNGDELFCKKVARLFFNETWRFPGTICKSILNKATCNPHDDMKLKIEIASTNDTLFSKVNYNIERVVETKSFLQSRQKLSPSCDPYFNATEGSVSKAGSMIRLQDQLKNMFLDPQYHDVNLEADGEIFPAHKAVLSARSPVFSAMFNQDMLESKTGVVEILDTDANSLKIFVEYLYSGTVETMNYECAIQLLVIADKYEVLCLKELCSNFLKSALSTTNVYDVIHVADMVNDAALKLRAMNYIVRYSGNILTTPEWSTWVESNGKLATEVICKLSKNLDTASKKLFDRQ